MEKLIRTIAVLVIVAGFPALLSAQAGGTISGQVVDSGTGQPLSNVQVFVSGTSLGTLSNVQGRYTLSNVPAGSFEIRASRLGYASATQTVTIATGATATADFQLSTSAVALDALVVTGTAGATERRATAAVVASVSASDITERAPVSSIQDLLTARVPGVSLTASSGSTGTAQQIRIRGAGSISLSNEPLVMIDGVLADSRTQSDNAGGGLWLGGQAQSRLADLNPADIESIEIVKGPAAATLYGADASAGVIQIITKRGRLGANQFVQGLTVEYNDINPNFDPLTSFLRCTPTSIAPVAPGLPTRLCTGLADSTVVTDSPLARNDVFRSGHLRSIGYNARGGGSNYGYYVSLGVDEEVGTLPNNEMDRRTARLNFNFTPNSKVSVDAALGIVDNDTQLPMNDNNVYGYLGIAYLGSPSSVLVDSLGNKTGGTYASRPFEAVKAIESVNKNLRFTPSLQINYTPTTWFTNTLTLGGDLTNSRSYQYFPINTLNWYQGDTNTGDLEEIRVGNQIFTLNYLGTIRNQLTERIGSSFSFGTQINTEEYERLTSNGVGFVTTANRVIDAATQISSTQGYANTKRVGVLGHWDLSLDDRLYLNLGLRVDKNSSFGSDAEAFYLPKFGVSYVISDEGFWDGLSGAIPSLRLRAAWGQTGRSPNPGASLETYEPRPFAIYGGSGSGAGVQPYNPGNPNLRPERGTEIELGFDAGLFNDRMGLELTYFDKTNTDLLLQVPVPPSSAATSNPWANIGEVKNTGIEYLLHGTLVSTPDIEWTAQISGSTLKNELTDLGGVAPFGTVARFDEGYSLGYLSSRKIREVVLEAGDSRCPIPAGGSTPAPCVIVADDNEFIGNSLPTYEGNFSSSLTLLGNLILSGSVDWKGGNRIYHNTKQFRDRSFGTSELAVKREEIASKEEVMRRYGPFVQESRDAAGGLIQVGVASVHEEYYEKADFVRIREVAATYLLPSDLANRFRASSASFTIGVRNLALFTDFTGPDPEVLSGGSAGTGTGAFVREEFFTVPQPRRLVAKMNLSF